MTSFFPRTHGSDRSTAQGEKGHIEPENPACRTRHAQAESIELGREEELAARIIGNVVALFTIQFRRHAQGIAKGCPLIAESEGKRKKTADHQKNKRQRPAGRCFPQANEKEHAKREQGAYVEMVDRCNEGTDESH